MNYYVRQNSLEVEFVGHCQNKSIYRAFVCSSLVALLKLNTVFFPMPWMISFSMASKKQYWFDTDMNLESVFSPVTVPPIEQLGKIVYKHMCGTVDPFCSNSRWWWALTLILRFQYLLNWRSHQLRKWKCCVFLIHKTV